MTEPNRIQQWVSRALRRLRRHAGLDWSGPRLSAETAAGRATRTMRRFHHGAALAFAAMLCLLVLLVMRQAAIADAALGLAAMAGRQPALALRLAQLDPVAEAAGQRRAFEETLATLEQESARLLAQEYTSRPGPGPELQLLYAGPRYALNARLQDLFALAHRLAALPAEADAAPMAAALRREVVEQVAERLSRAAEMHRAIASAQVQHMKAHLALGAGLAMLVPLLWLLGGIPLNARLGRTLGLLEWLAARDALTGALTHGAFSARLLPLVAAARPDAGLALLLLDLDDFRALNAGNGDAAGDAALRAVARRLRQAAGPQALVARLGSDSFAVALPGLVGGHAALAALATRLTEALRPPVPFAGQMLHIAATGGTALAPNDGTNRHELMRMANAALHQAKHEQKGSIQSFRTADPGAQSRRQALLQALATADLRGVEAWLQPLVRCSDSAPLRFEVLARWNHPTLGRISPAEFLPMAEALGRLPLLSAHVRNAAFMAMAALDRELAATPGLAPTPFGLSINLAPSEIAMPGAVAALQAALAAAGLAPHRLTIEVTEEMLVGSADEAAQEALQALRRQGVRLNLDNFGTGFANLAHLHRFPVDGLKIARPFIAAIGQDERAEAIIRGVVGLGHGLAIEVVAEGVETPVQLAFIGAAGCDAAQGYVIAAPMPAAEIPAWLRQPRNPE